jgi:ketosteroid isomerase-like protein
MNDEEQIIRLFQDGDRALMAVDMAELRRIYADDYMQYDESGKVITKEDLMRELSSCTTRLLSMTSTGRRVRVFGDFAVVHGSEDDEIEQNGRRFSARYLYMDVVVKRDGRWQIVASQLVKPGVEIVEERLGMRTNT